MTTYCRCQESEVNDDGDLTVAKHIQIQRPKPDLNYNDMKNQETSAPVDCATEDKEKMVEQRDSMILREIKNNFHEEGIPEFWMDRYKMQNAYSREAKGWKVQVKWEVSPIIGAGVGVFVAEDVKEGQVLRLANTGRNLIRFRKKSDLPQNMSSVTKNYISNYCGQVDDFTMLFLPGNCMNHAAEPNTIMVAADEETIHCVACQDIKAGTELTQDYNSFGEPPEYLKELSKNESMELVFSGYNEFL